MPVSVNIYVVVNGAILLSSPTGLFYVLSLDIYLIMGIEPGHQIKYVCQIIPFPSHPSQFNMTMTQP